MTNCAFYGFRWPERSAILRFTGGNECGMDLDKNGPCTMELANRPIEYCACPIVRDRRILLEHAKQRVCFAMPDSPPLSLADWERGVRPEINQETGELRGQNPRLIARPQTPSHRAVE
jgi:hypothetical protein